MRTILLLLLCLHAHAALPPMPSVPTVKRTVPLLSPRHASQPKSTPMFVTASENPRLPMKAYFRIANSEFGKYELTAESLQPMGYALLFEVSPTPKDWQPLAWFGPYVVNQQVFAALYSHSATLNIRATAQPPTASAPAILREASSTVVLAETGIPLKSATRPARRIAVNPMLGARAWVGK